MVSNNTKLFQSHSNCSDKNGQRYQSQICVQETICRTSQMGTYRILFEHIIELGRVLTYNWTQYVNIMQDKMTHNQIEAIRQLQLLRFTFLRALSGTSSLLLQSGKEMFVHFSPSWARYCSYSGFLVTCSHATGRDYTELCIRSGALCTLVLIYLLA